MLRRDGKRKQEKRKARSEGRSGKGRGEEREWRCEVMRRGWGERMEEWEKGRKEGE